MSLFKKHCWVLLIPLLAILYWKRGKEAALSHKTTPVYVDSFSSQIPVDFKTIVIK